MVTSRTIIRVECDRDTPLGVTSKAVLLFLSLNMVELEYSSIYYILEVQVRDLTQVSANST